MKKMKVLIVGGYGNVGRVVSEILAQAEHILPIIAGRNASKAQALADQLHADWRIIDLADRPSISPALVDMDMVINCFSGPFTHFPLWLPEFAAKQGIHYVDVAGSYEYAERFLALNNLASRHKAILITALGVNPGIPGILFVSAKDEFDKLVSGTVYFVLGSKLDGISVSSLKELKYMFDVKPLVWERSRWIKPKHKGKKAYVGEPFNKEIYLGLSLTRDLFVLPQLTGVQSLTFWSGSQSALQGLVMILGLKLGLTGSDRSARWLMNVLKRVGRTKSGISDALVIVEAIGNKDGTVQRKVFEMHCDENYATAIAPAIVCQQIAEGKIEKQGAFVPPEVVPAQDFMNRLRTFETHFSTTTEVA